ncbi:hypothetical protein BH09BAC3_BH09BAC3_28150 [soil metagenome]
MVEINGEVKTLLQVTDCPMQVATPQKRFWNPNYQGLNNPIENN